MGNKAHILKSKLVHWNYKYHKVVGILFLTVFAMTFMPYGTFDPTEHGF